MTSWDLIPAGINQLTQQITEVILVNNLNNLNWHKVQSNMQPIYPFRSKSHCSLKDQLITIFPILCLPHMTIMMSYLEKPEPC